MGDTIYYVLFFVALLSVVMNFMEAIKGTFSEAWDEAFHDDSNNK